MSNLTKTQEFMIGQIEKALKDEKAKLKKANDSEKFKIRLKIKNLEQQLENAKKPFKRTEKEKQLINKIAGRVKENTEIMAGAKIEGDRADKPLTSKEEFEHGMSMFLLEVKNRKEQLAKDITVQETVVAVLENGLNDHPEIKDDVESRKNIVAQMKMSMKLFEDRIAGAEIQKWALDNYEMLSKLNTWLNNPLKLKDYEDYATALRNEFDIK